MSEANAKLVGILVVLLVVCLWAIVFHELLTTGPR